MTMLHLPLRQVEPVVAVAIAVAVASCLLSASVELHRLVDAAAQRPLSQVVRLPQLVSAAPLAAVRSRPWSLETTITWLLVLLALLLLLLLQASLHQPSSFDPAPLSLLRQILVLLLLLSQSESRSVLTPLASSSLSLSCLPSSSIVLCSGQQPELRALCHPRSSFGTLLRARASRLRAT
jgi:hypothetical protein